MQVDTTPGLDVAQAEKLAVRMFEVLVEDPDVSDSGTCLAGIVILARHALCEAERQAERHELTEAGNSIRAIFCRMIMHPEL